MAEEERTTREMNDSKHLTKLALIYLPLLDLLFLIGGFYAFDGSEPLLGRATRPHFAANRSNRACGALSSVLSSGPALQELGLARLSLLGPLMMRRGS